MMIYDVTSPDSLESVGRWQADVARYAPNAASLILVGNKCDEAAAGGTRAVQYEEAKVIRREGGERTGRRGEEGEGGTRRVGIFLLIYCTETGGCIRGGVHGDECD